jgi:hemerythrin
MTLMKTSHDRYTLGFPEMDEQHRYLYELFDRLEQKTQLTSQVGVKALLGEIERYVLFHFACEEHLMRAYGDPGFAVHQSDHEQMGNKLVQFLDDFDAGRLNPAAMRIFLTGWLMEHSEISDAAYVRWILECRKKVREGLKR